MQTNHTPLTAEARNEIMHWAWQDHCSFERIEKDFGLTESEVIKLMRAHLKPGSFRRWRKRVSGRVTKHRKRFKRLDAFKGSFE